MPSFRISVEPHRRVAGRFIAQVRGKLQKAYAESPDVRQTDIAEKLGVHRSVINRQLRGYQDMTLGRVAEIAWALGREPQFSLIKPDLPAGTNHELDQFTVETKPTSGQVTMRKTDLELSA